MMAYSARFCDSAISKNRCLDCGAAAVHPDAKSFIFHMNPPFPSFDNRVRLSYNGIIVN
jgi:hypothetical protein